MANFMGREEHWAHPLLQSPQLPNWAARVQQKVSCPTQVPLRQCPRLTWSFSPSLPSGCTEGAPATEEVHTVPSSRSISTEHVSSNVCGVNYLVNLIKKYWKPLGMLGREILHGCYCYSSTFFWTIGAPAGTTKINFHGVTAVVVPTEL